MQFLNCATLLVLVSACTATLKGGYGGSGLIGSGLGKFYLAYLFA